MGLHKLLTQQIVFTMQVNATQGVNCFNTFYSSNGRSDININDTYLDLYETGETRRDLFYDDGGSVYCGKFENNYGNVHLNQVGRNIPD